MPEIQNAFEIALRRHQAGQLIEAEQIYRQILAVAPGHASAWHLLGVIASQTGRNELAAQMIRQAIALSPGQPYFHYNLAFALREQGLPAEAVAEYRRAIQLKPDYAEAHNNLGNLLKDQGCHDEALASYRRATQCGSGNAEAHNNLGNALKETGSHEEALAEYGRAVQIKPGYVEAWSNQGNIFKQLGRYGAALAAYLQAVKIQPHSAENWDNLGAVFSEEGRLQEALDAGNRALALKPDYAAAHYHQGIVLSKSGRLIDAAAAYRRALELQPNLDRAQNNLGNVLKDQGCVDAAIEAYRQAMRIKPDEAKYHSNLLLSLHYLSNREEAEIFREHGLWNETHAQPLLRAMPPAANDRDPDRRLRIGYVSPDLREHPVACFMEGLLADHDRDRFEVFCYDDAPRADHVTARLRSHVANWRQIARLSDARVAELIRKDGIDILVDLAGHTADNRLLVFARRPAPIQAAYLGYCDTTGMTAIDFRLTDAWADPPGVSESLHAEELIRIPGGAWCFGPMAAPPVSPPPALRNKQITFGCFNALPKLTETMLRLWAELLRTVPASRLLLKNLGFRDPAVLEQTRVSLAGAGLDLERVELEAPCLALADHLAAYGRIDIALDTFPYHGTTTTCEALWMGVPVITLKGRAHAARVGVSLLSSVDLPEFIADHSRAYVEIAAALSLDVPRLAELRATLRQRMAASPLLDSNQLARKIESAYRKMWRGWCAEGRAV